MGFDTEPSGYEKTLLSDLQGAWECLREEVVEHLSFNGWERVLFHIDEAMSWESVRHLRQMQRSLVLVRNLLHQGDDVPDAVAECLDAVSELMDETLKTHSDAKIDGSDSGPPIGQGTHRFFAPDSEVFPCLYHRVYCDDQEKRPWARGFPPAG